MTASFITRAEVNSQFATVVALNLTAAACTAVGTSLAAEVSRAILAENILTTNVATAIANLNNEITSRTNSVATLATAITTEITRALAAENTLTINVATVTANLNTESTGRAALSNSVTTIITNVTTLIANLNFEITARNALSTSLTAEISRAFLAEGVLTTNLATLNINVNNEISLTATLETDLTSEVVRAMAREDALSVAILATSFAVANATCSNSGGASQQITGQEYWIETSVLNTEPVGLTIVTANLPIYTLHIYGVGFATYFDPDFQASFLCVFYHPLFGGNLTSFGYVVPSSRVVVNATNTLFDYHVECPVPVISKNLLATMSLYKPSGQLYPFAGFPGFNTLTVNYFWVSYEFQPVSGNIVLTGLGFNLSSALQYLCVYTGVNVTGGNFTVTSQPLNATNLTSVNCGLAPTGFLVINGFIIASIMLFERNIITSFTAYQVPSYLTTNNSISYNACFNRAQDGTETGN